MSLKNRAVRIGSKEQKECSRLLEQIKQSTEISLFDGTILLYYVL